MPIDFDPTMDALTAELETLKQRIREAETLEDLKDLQRSVEASEENESDDDGVDEDSPSVYDGLSTLEVFCF